MRDSTLPDEERLLLLLSTPLPEKICEDEIATILTNNDSLDYKKIYGLAVTNGVAGFVYKNSQNKSIFPKPIQTDLHKFYRQTAFNNIQLFRKTLEILQVLSRNNIRTIPLKGATASDLVFSDFGVYPSGDIDILVHPSDLQLSKKLLCSKGGFYQIQGIAENDLLSDHYHLILQSNKALLEIHWNLVKRYFRISPDFWFEDSKEILWNGIHTFELSIEKYIIYHIFRLFDHCFYPLRFYILLGSIIDQNPDRINWEKLIGFSDHYKMKRLVIFCLGLLKDLLNTNIPPHLLPRKNRRYQYLKGLALHGIFSGLHNKHRRMMLYTLLLIKPETLIAILTKRIVPSKGELRLRYSIPPESKKIYLFYILNPFLLLFKKSKAR